MSAPKSILAITVSLCALSGLVSAVAGAYATVAPPPSSSTSSGLPDGRVYEEASPANKHGYQAGAVGATTEEPIRVFFSIASQDGNAVAYSALGPAAETNASGLNEDFVAERTSQGWKSRSATGRGRGTNEKFSLWMQEPNWRDYSVDLSHLVYAVLSADVPQAPEIGSSNFYELGSDPLAEPTWLFQSAPDLSNPELAEQSYEELVGMSPDASIVYIGYPGHLFPQDASRSGWGLYEYRNGRLSEAGVLPNGSVPSSGATPAATSTSTENYKPGENNPASLDNQVSEDGRRVFFVSSGELYMHETTADGSERSVLVSASQVTGHLGEAAPHGVALFENPTKNGEHEGKVKSAPTYAYASSDGSHVFFQSEDQLSATAPAGGLKVYAFDVDTGSLEYLPAVSLGGIVTAAHNGSSFVFVNSTTSTPELDIWSAGPGGGSVHPIAQLPGGGFVGPARMVSDDSILVFQAQAPIAGFNDAGGEQIFRYVVGTNELDCVSCPPAGVKPSGNAYLSAVDQYADQFGYGTQSARVVNDARGVSADGERIFFDSPDPLVGRDTNGELDAYEWENGTVFLISSGTSSEYSLFLDNSPSGGDVFFTTSDELVQGDSDEGFDVYDARIPRPGDNPPPSALPCSGDVCQGPPSVPQLLGAPPSATFNGAGNIVEPSPSKVTSTVKAKSPKSSAAQGLVGALRACHKLKSRRRRTACDKQARKRHQAKPAITKHNGKRGQR